MPIGFKGASGQRKYDKMIKMWFCLEKGKQAVTALQM